MDHGQGGRASRWEDSSRPRPCRDGGRQVGLEGWEGGAHMLENELLEKMQLSVTTESKATDPVLFLPLLLPRMGLTVDSMLLP